MIRVMIIDDSLLARKAIETVLEEDPEISIVGSAPNGKVALPLIAEHKPQVVTCDLEMPEMDGVHTLMEIRKQFPQVKVIILSSLSQPNSPKEKLCRNLGAYAVLAKPMENSNIRLAEQKVELLAKIKGA